MIEDGRGDLLRADAEALVNTVNTVGHMGKGIALQFKQAYPENFKAYAQAVRKGAVQPGRMFVVPTGHVTNPRYIINFPTKRHWRSRREALRLRPVPPAADWLATNGGRPGAGRRESLD